MERMIMKLCILTSYFYPEEFKVNDIAFELAKIGYNVTVITAIPNYPFGIFFTGYSFFKKRKEIINGVHVIRLPVIPRGNGRFLGLILNYLSYLISSVLFVLFKCRINEFDAIFVHVNSPFTIGIPAVILKKKLKIPLFFWVLDLWPESVQSAGGVGNRQILAILNNMVRWVYDNCDKILIGSKGYAQSICEKGNYWDKLEYFPNWTEDVFSIDSIINEDFKLFIPLSKDDFVILFAGNLGEAQGLDDVIEAAKLTENNKKIKWIFVGDGRKRNYLLSKVEDYSLQDTVFLPGRFPLSTMPFFMAQANLLLVSLKDENIFNLTVPSKVQTYMMTGKPILAMLNGDGAQLIKEAECGFTVSTGDYISLAHKAEEIFHYSSDYLDEVGANGKKYYDLHFTKAERIKQLDELIKNLRGPRE